MFLLISTVLGCSHTFKRTAYFFDLHYKIWHHRMKIYCAFKRCMESIVNDVTLYCYNTIAKWKAQMPPEGRLPCLDPYLEQDRLLQLVMTLFDVMQVDKPQILQWSHTLKVNACLGVRLLPVFQNFTYQVYEVSGIHHKTLERAIKRLLDQNIPYQKTFGFIINENETCARLSFCALLSYWVIYWMHDSSVEHESTLSMIDEHLRYLIIAQDELCDVA